MTLTSGQAKEIIDAHEITQDLIDPESEEGSMLKEHNPSLFHAYEAILKFASE